MFDLECFTVHRVKFDEKLPNHEDWDAWVKVFLMEPRVVVSEKELATYRLRQDSISIDTSMMYKGFRFAINKNIINIISQKRLDLRVRLVAVFMLVGKRFEIYQRYVVREKVNSLVGRGRNILKSIFRKLPWFIQKNL